MTPKPGGKSKPSFSNSGASIKPSEPADSPLASASQGVASDRHTGALDVAIPLGRTEQGVAVARLRNGRVEAAVLTSVREGEAIQGEVVSLEPRTDHANVYNVKVLFDPSEASPPRADSSPDSCSGPSDRGRPPQVASDRYRGNWQRIFAKSLN